MKVILLCAGYATRLYPLTLDKPKPLLSVAGKPIIEYLLENIIQIKKIDAVYIVTNNKFADIFKDWENEFQFPLPIIIINDKTMSNDDRLGAIGDLYYTIQQSHIDDDVLVIAGDNLFDLNMIDFCNFAEKNKPYASIAVFDVKHKDLARKYGLVELNNEGQVIDFKEKPEKPRTTLASLALYFYPQETIKFIEKYIHEGNNPDQPGHYAAWLSRCYKVYAYPFDGHWFDVGDFDSLEKANLFFKNKKVKQKES